MFGKLFRLLRLAVVAVVLGAATAPAYAVPRPRLHHPTPTADYDRAAPDARTKPERPPGDPELGVLWIALGVALLVFMVWVAVRIGDNDR
jgi:hypothetical protein